MRLPVFSLLLLCCISASSQTPKASRYEKHWAFCHPFAAMKLNKITKKVIAVYEISKTDSINDSFSNGGRLDAYRHVFFMAAYAQKIKAKKLRRLGEAHEKWNYVQYLMTMKEFGETPDSLSSVMDLKNNELGFEIGTKNKKVDLLTLKQVVKQELNAGKALIMKRNKAGLYLSCEGTVIDLKNYADQWYVPKCLVNSDFIYKD